MNIFLVNADTKHSEGLIKKLTDIKDGSIVPLTEGEMRLYNSDQFQHVYNGNEKQQLIEIDPEKNYIALLNEGHENIDDMLRVIDMFNLKIGIVRVRHGCS